MIGAPGKKMSSRSGGLNEHEKRGLSFYFEADKHLTTLNAGSIVVIATFLSDIFPSEDGVLNAGSLITGLVGVAIILFGLSLLCSVAGMFFIISARENDKPLSETPIEELIATLAPLGLFFLALLAFGVAVLINLWF
jgi:hypothetical protein